MRLSRLYANRRREFETIQFQRGINVVLAEIRLPENKNRDTHNLGKTTLGHLLDFCLLSRFDKGLFLNKYRMRFVGFFFFLEVELLDGGFVTLRRGVDAPSKISFKYHKTGHQDYARLADAEWDHLNVGFEKSKELLDSALDLRVYKPWGYRKGLGYCLRAQDDFGDVFQLARFAAHADWKPFVAHLLGFDGKAVADLYEKEIEVARKTEEVATLRRELSDRSMDLTKVEGLLLLKREELAQKSRGLEAFNFAAADRARTEDLVGLVNAEIASLNRDRYHLLEARKRIRSALAAERFDFDPAEAERLFSEAGMVFPGQLKKDFEQLIDFNRAITEERASYLRLELREVELALGSVDSRVTELSTRRSRDLSFLQATDVVEKYRLLTAELVALRADIAELDRERERLGRLLRAERELRELADERERLRNRVEEDVQRTNEDHDALFAKVRLFFSSIVEEVINRKALLTVGTNRKGAVEFDAEILDEGGKSTGAAKGHSYKRLLCVAFDMALARVYQDQRYPHFLFHDGVFESLDDRKKGKMLDVIRRYSGFGIQHVFTLIDSDMPPIDAESGSTFMAGEVVLLLHDESEDGRLFKMSSW